MFNINNHNFYQYNKDDIDKLYHHNVHTFWSTLILSSLFILILWFYSNTADHTLLIWYGLLNILSSIRLKINSQPNKNLIDEKKGYYQKWVNQYLLLTTSMSVLWGLAGFYFWPSDNHYITSSLILMLLSVLISMTSLVLISKFALYSQATLLIFPILLRLSINDTNHDSLFVSLAILTNVIVIIISAYFLIQILQSLRQSKYELQNKIDQDPITGLVNKRAFDRAFRKEWRRAIRSKKALSLLIIDIDNFKDYISLTSLAMSNQCLINIAKEIQIIARRPADLSSRTDSNQFSILLPSTHIKGAEIVANRLKEHIENLSICFPNSERQVITVSIGISSCYPSYPEDNNIPAKNIIYPAMLLSQANYALQKAKEAGKNCCVTELFTDNNMDTDLKRKLDLAEKRNSTR